MIRLGPCLAITASFQLKSGVALYGGFALTETARELLRSDEGRRRRPTKGHAASAFSAPGEAPSSSEEVWIRVCVEMALRPLGLGRPELEGASQHALLESLLGSDYAGDPSFHRSRTDYLLRRIRKRWFRRPE